MVSRASFLANSVIFSDQFSGELLIFRWSLLFFRQTIFLSFLAVKTYQIFIFRCSWLFQSVKLFNSVFFDSNWSRTVCRWRLTVWFNCLLLGALIKCHKKQLVQMVTTRTATSGNSTTEMESDLRELVMDLQDTFNQLAQTVQTMSTYFVTPPKYLNGSGMEYLRV